MQSIRAFLVVVILSVVCLSTFLAALTGYRDSLAAIDLIEHRQIEEKGDILAALMANGSSVPGHLFNDNTMFQVWEDGVLGSRSGNAPEWPLYSTTQKFNLRSYQGNQWLVFSGQGGGEGVVIAVASVFRGNLTLTEEVLVRTILPTIWVLPILGVLIWGVVNYGLRPLKQLAGNLEERAVDDLSTLSTISEIHELRPIFQALNDLFCRLSDAFDRERRFSADAAHELRTPLSVLKVSLYNAARNNNDEESWDSLQRSVDRMEHLIEQLLSQYRISSSAELSRNDRLDLKSVVRDVIVEMYDQVAIKSQEIELTGESVELRGDVYLLEVMLRNLVDNASKYSPDGAKIRITVSQLSGLVGLLVEDSGGGLPESEYQRVLERFYRHKGRGDEPLVNGSGLGLSIVSDIANQYEGYVMLSRSADLGGFAIRIVLSPGFSDV